MPKKASKKASCCCPRHFGWGHVCPVDGQLRVANVQEKRFCDVSTDRRHNNRKRFVCVYCRDRIKLEVLKVSKWCKLIYGELWNLLSCTVYMWYRKLLDKLITSYMMSLFIRLWMKPTLKVLHKTQLFWLFCSIFKCRFSHSPTSEYHKA